MLNEKQKMFCEEYVGNGYKAIPAYEKVYTGSSHTSSISSAGRILKHPEIKAYIREIQHDRLEALNINADRIAEELSKMAFAEFDNNNTASTKQKALELLGKQLGLYTQKIDANVSADININIEDDE